MQRTPFPTPNPFPASPADRGSLTLWLAAEHTARAWICAIWVRLLEKQTNWMAGYFLAAYRENEPHPDPMSKTRLWTAETGEGWWWWWWGGGHVPWGHLKGHAECHRPL